MSGVSRRSFLKLLGIGTVAVATLDSVLSRLTDAAEYSHFDPMREYGSSVMTTDILSDSEAAELYAELFDEGVSESIPPEYRSKIRYWYVEPDCQSDPLNEKGFLIWKYSPNHEVLN